MTDAPITHAECNLHMDDIRAALREGFGGIHTRLDKLNGKTEAHAISIAEIKERARVAVITPEDSRRRSITIWDILLVTGSVAIAFEILTRVLGYHL